MIRPCGMLILLISMLVFATPGLATPIITHATLSGGQEVPPNLSQATGTAEADFDLAAHSLFVKEVFSGLSAPATAAHIHAPAPLGSNAGVAVFFTGFPGATSGTYTRTFDTSLSSTFNPSFITANGGTVASAEAALAAFLSGGTAYVNIHNANFPGGEIRGQLTPVPEPMTMLLLGSGLTGLAALKRRSKAS